MVSYYDPDGHYSSDTALFDWPLKTPPLTAVKSDYVDAGGGNGVFNAGSHGFPTQLRGSSYAVDVIFDTTPPAGSVPSVSGRHAGCGVVEQSDLYGSECDVLGAGDAQLACRSR